MPPIDDRILDEQFQAGVVTDHDYEQFNLAMDDDTLLNMLARSLNENVEHWNKAPWSLEETDKRNVNYLLGEREQDITVVIDDKEFTNNRLFTAVRAILSYATGQMAKPEIGPTSNDTEDKKLAAGIGLGLYQHSLEEDADDLFRVCLLNLITRKRAYLKLRYDPDAGVDGDVVTDTCNPEDITLDRFAAYKKEPNIRYQRLTCTVDEMCAKFPAKKDVIYNFYNIERGVFTQISKVVEYYETWFTFFEGDDKAYGVAWFIPDSGFILDKMKNPNWIYKGSAKNQKKVNVLNAPPQPYVDFSYFNLGKSHIDETCLFDQAVPLQKLINKRLKQITDNADYVNGRWVMNKDAVDEDDAKGFVNKGTNTTLLVKSEDVGKAVVNIQSSQLPAYVYQSLLDAYGQLDSIMGTPNQFRGEGSDASNTLGKDQMIQQQASTLQDDLVRAVNKAAKRYYELKLHLMNVNYTEDHKFSEKAADGNYNFFIISGDGIDPNVKVSVEIDSTLPLDKSSISAVAQNLARLNRIDNLTLFEDLRLDNPELRAERLMRQQLSPLGYMQSMQALQENNDAELDIRMVEAGKTPDERSVYDEPYLTYWNNFMTTNRFTMIQRDNPKAAQRLVTFLQFIQQKAQQMAQLQSTQQPTQLDDAGLVPFQAPPIIPKVSITGALSQGDSMQMARVNPAQNPQVPPNDQIQQQANGRILAQPTPGVTAPQQPQQPL